MELESKGARTGVLAGIVLVLVVVLVLDERAFSPNVFELPAMQSSRTRLGLRHRYCSHAHRGRGRERTLGARLPGASSTLESLLSYRPSWTRTNHDTQWRCGTDYKHQSYWVLVRTRIRRDLSYNRPARESGQCNEQP